MTKTKKAKTKPKSTALAIRKPKAAQVVIHDPHHLMPQPEFGMIGQLGEVATVGALGLSELKLTSDEEKVLARPVNPQDILVRDGGIAYLPHIVYTRWFNDAFGRVGWAIVPTGKPQRADNVVVVPYMLYVHGKPVAMAWGEQEYHESNKRQTYGDVIESTVASGLRRLAKRLGVGLEMWDKAWLEQTIKTRNLPKKPATQSGDQWPPETVKERKAAGLPTVEVSVITKGQWDQLGRIAEKHGRNDAEVGLWLKNTYGPLRNISQQHYTAIKNTLEAHGPLPMPGDAE